MVQGVQFRRRDLQTKRVPRFSWITPHVRQKRMRWVHQPPALQACVRASNILTYDHVQAAEAARKLIANGEEGKACFQEGHGSEPCPTIDYQPKDGERWCVPAVHGCLLEHTHFRSLMQSAPTEQARRTGPPRACSGSVTRKLAGINTVRRCSKCNASGDRGRRVL